MDKVYQKTRQLIFPPPVPINLKAKIPENAEKLVDLSVTLEQRLLQVHLSEDATNGPDVHASAVARATKEHLWSSVPKRHDLYDCRNVVENVESQDSFEGGGNEHCSVQCS